MFVADRVNKMPLVLTFLAAYFVLFTVTAFVGNPMPVAEIFRTPDVEAVLYFAFIILTDPPTSPAKYPDQIVCGLIVAVVSYAFFEWQAWCIICWRAYWRESVGGVAPGEPSNRKHVPERPGQLSTGDQSVAEGKALPARAALMERRYSKGAGR